MFIWTVVQGPEDPVGDPAGEDDGGDYLGRGRMLKDPEEAEAVRKFPPPTTLKQMQ